MSLIPEAHPAGSINAVQIGSRPICISLAAFLQLELSRVYNLVTYLATQEKSVLRQLFFWVYDWPLLISYYRWL
ncbi:hypothetical protein A6J64_001755 [Yersinia enterocolitica]|nr:hypothetical protein A6J63_016540 [Yersinia enterocolitica]PNM15608.1 hypothetical protein A6J64_001755 [Yersinia enterocolitica]PNM18622.1 hypothetical protein A6J65_006870 [Yersinia enterocolitica]RLZ01873.1 hypothetical protein COO51_00575 [Yersinia enterocolitica]